MEVVVEDGQFDEDPSKVVPDITTFVFEPERVFRYASGLNYEGRYARFFLSSTLGTGGNYADAPGFETPLLAPVTSFYLNSRPYPVYSGYPVVDAEFFVPWCRRNGIAVEVSKQGECWGGVDFLRDIFSGVHAAVVSIGRADGDEPRIPGRSVVMGPHLSEKHVWQLLAMCKGGPDDILPAVLPVVADYEEFVDVVIRAAPHAFEGTVELVGPLKRREMERTAEQLKEAELTKKKIALLKDLRKQAKEALPPNYRVYEPYVPSVSSPTSWAARSSTHAARNWLTERLGKGAMRIFDEHPFVVPSRAVSCRLHEEVFNALVSMVFVVFLCINKDVRAEYFQHQEMSDAVDKTNRMRSAAEVIAVIKKGSYHIFPPIHELGVKIIYSVLMETHATHGAQIANADILDALVNYVPVNYHTTTEAVSAWYATVFAETGAPPTASDRTLVYARLENFCKRLNPVFSRSTPGVDSRFYRNIALTCAAIRVLSQYRLPIAHLGRDEDLIFFLSYVNHAASMSLFKQRPKLSPLAHSLYSVIINNISRLGDMSKAYATSYPMFTSADKAEFLAEETTLGRRMAILMRLLHIPADVLPNAAEELHPVRGTKLNRLDLYQKLLLPETGAWALLDFVRYGVLIIADSHRDTPQAWWTEALSLPAKLNTFLDRLNDEFSKNVSVSDNVKVPAIFGIVEKVSASIVEAYKPYKKPPVPPEKYPPQVYPSLRYADLFVVVRGYVNAVHQRFLMSDEGSVSVAPIEMSPEVTPPLEASMLFLEEFLDGSRWSRISTTHAIFDFAPEAEAAYVSILNLRIVRESLTQLRRGLRAVDRIGEAVSNVHVATPDMVDRCSHVEIRYHIEVASARQLEGLHVGWIWKPARDVKNTGWRWAVFPRKPRSREQVLQIPARDGVEGEYAMIVGAPAAGWQISPSANVAVHLRCLRTGEVFQEAHNTPVSATWTSSRPVHWAGNREAVRISELVWAIAMLELVDRDQINLLRIYKDMGGLRTERAAEALVRVPGNIILANTGATIGRSREGRVPYSNRLFSWGTSMVMGTLSNLGLSTRAVAGRAAEAVGEAVRTSAVRTRQIATEAGRAVASAGRSAIDAGADAAQLMNDFFTFVVDTYEFLPMPMGEANPDEIPPPRPAAGPLSERAAFGHGTGDACGASMRDIVYDSPSAASKSSAEIVAEAKKAHAAAVTVIVARAYATFEEMEASVGPQQTTALWLFMEMLIEAQNMSQEDNSALAAYAKSELAAAIERFEKGRHELFEVTNTGWHSALTRHPYATIIPPDRWLDSPGTLAAQMDLYREFQGDHNDAAEWEVDTWSRLVEAALGRVDGIDARAPVLISWMAAVQAHCAWDGKVPHVLVNDPRLSAFRSASSIFCNNPTLASGLGHLFGPESPWFDTPIKAASMGIFSGEVYFPDNVALGMADADREQLERERLAVMWHTSQAERNGLNTALQTYARNAAWAQDALYQEHHLACVAQMRYLRSHPSGMHRADHVGRAIQGPPRGGGDDDSDDDSDGGGDLGIGMSGESAPPQRARARGQGRGAQASDETGSADTGSESSGESGPSGGEGVAVPPQPGGNTYVTNIIIQNPGAPAGPVARPSLSSRSSRRSRAPAADAESGDTASDEEPEADESLGRLAADVTADVIRHRDPYTARDEIARNITARLARFQREAAREEAASPPLVEEILRAGANAALANAGVENQSRILEDLQRQITAASERQEERIKSEEKVKREIEEAKSEVLRIKDEKVKVEAKLEEVVKASGVDETKYKDVKERLDTAMASVAERDREISRLTGVIFDSAEEEWRLKGLVAKSERDVDRLVVVQNMMIGTNDRLVADIERLDREKKRTQLGLNASTAEVAALEARLASLDTERSKMEKTADEIKKEKSDIERELRLERKRTTNQAQVLKQNKASLKDLQEQLAQSTDAADKVREALAAENLEKQKLAKRLRELELEGTQSRTAMASLRARLSEAEVDAQTSRDEMTRLQARADRDSSEKVDLSVQQQRFNDLQDRLRKREARVLELERDIESVRRQAEEMSETSFMTTASSEALSARKEAELERLRELEVESRREARRMQGLAAQRADRIYDLETKIGALEAHIAEATANAARAETELVEERTTTQETLAELRGMIAQFNEEADSLRGRRQAEAPDFVFDVATIGEPSSSRTTRERVAEVVVHAESQLFAAVGNAAPGAIVQGSALQTGLSRVFSDIRAQGVVTVDSVNESIKKWIPWIKDKARGALATMIVITVGASAVLFSYHGMPEFDFSDVMSYFRPPPQQVDPGVVVVGGYPNPIGGTRIDIQEATGGNGDEPPPPSVLELVFSNIGEAMWDSTLRRLLGYVAGDIYEGVRDRFSRWPDDLGPVMPEGADDTGGVNWPFIITIGAAFGAFWNGLGRDQGGASDRGGPSTQSVPPGQFAFSRTNAAFSGTATSEQVSAETAPMPVFFAAAPSKAVPTPAGPRLGLHPKGAFPEDQDVPPLEEGLDASTKLYSLRNRVRRDTETLVRLVESGYPDSLDEPRDSDGAVPDVAGMRIPVHTIEQGASEGSVLDKAVYYTDACIERVVARCEKLVQTLDKVSGDSAATKNILGRIQTAAEYDKAMGACFDGLMEHAAALDERLANPWSANNVRELEAARLGVGNVISRLRSLRIEVQKAIEGARDRVGTDHPHLRAEWKSLPPFPGGLWALFDPVVAADADDIIEHLTRVAMEALEDGVEANRRVEDAIIDASLSPELFLGEFFSGYEKGRAMLFDDFAKLDNELRLAYQLYGAIEKAGPKARNALYSRLGPVVAQLVRSRRDAATLMLGAWVVSAFDGRDFFGPQSDIAAGAKPFLARTIGDIIRSPIVREVIIHGGLVLDAAAAPGSDAYKRDALREFLEAHVGDVEPLLVETQTISAVALAVYGPDDTELRPLLDALFSVELVAHRLYATGSTYVKPPFMRGGRHPIVAQIISQAHTDAVYTGLQRAHALLDTGELRASDVDALDKGLAHAYEQRQEGMPFGVSQNIRSMRRNPVLQKQG